MDSDGPAKYTYMVLNEKDYSKVFKIVEEEFNTWEPTSTILKMSTEECEILHGPAIQVLFPYIMRIANPSFTSVGSDIAKACVIRSDTPGTRAIYSTRFAHSSTPGWVKKSLKGGVSVGAFCRDTESLAGCILSQLGKDITVEDDASDLDNVPLKVKQFLELESPMLKPGISTVLGTENYFYSSTLVCRKQDGGRGVGTELLRRSVEIARAAGCEKYLILSNSDYVQRMVEKMGFKTEKEIYYKDYIDPHTNRKIFANIPEPHVKSTRVVKTL